MSEQPVAEQQDKAILVETIGSVLWFIMDGLWMLNQAYFAKAMVLPTLFVNLWVFRYTRPTFSQFAVVGAMNSWLVMNICWMMGDLDKDPKPLEFARIMFAVGIALLALAVARNAMQPEALSKVLTHFRRLRI